VKPKKREARLPKAVECWAFVDILGRIQMAYDGCPSLTGGSIGRARRLADTIFRGCTPIRVRIVPIRARRKK
jgi:hypothetical protein